MMPMPMASFFPRVSVISFLLIRVTIVTGVMRIHGRVSRPSFAGAEVMRRRPDMIFIGIENTDFSQSDLDNIDNIEQHPNGPERKAHTPQPAASGPQPRLPALPLSGMPFRYPARA